MFIYDIFATILLQILFMDYGTIFKYIIYYIWHFSAIVAMSEAWHADRHVEPYATYPTGPPGLTSHNGGFLLYRREALHTRSTSPFL
jgi:hypothetical protein